MAYFVEGRVKVTYIIGTVLVTVLTEVLAFWFKDMDTARIAVVIALVLSSLPPRHPSCPLCPCRE